MNMPVMIINRRNERMNKKFLLIDADSQTGFPNLALMKISAYYKKYENATVELRLGVPDSLPLETYDGVFISCVYFQNRPKVWNYAQQLKYPVQVGGSGFDLQKTLPEKVEHMKPDYALYNIEYSMGFTSRGCVRKCGFCVVHEKEGLIRDHASITEFHFAYHRNLVLLDNNFLASPKWKENLEYVIDNKLRINFNQGLDIRLINNENATMLAETEFRTWKFNTKRLAFAYDSLRYKRQVKAGVQTLADAGIKPYRLMFYVLVGYDTTIYEDLDRIDTLVKLGVDPYIMRYNQNEGTHRILMHLARWVNWRAYKMCSFFDYDYSDSQEAIKKAFETPHKSWGGYYCSHGAYAWAHRDIDLETEQVNEIQTELEDYEQEK